MQDMKCAHFNIANAQFYSKEKENMTNLFYQPKNAWVGDLIPYYDNGVYYAFYLHDPRCMKDQYAEETTWHLVTTRDFVNVTYHGEAVKRGNNREPNRNAYTGSVVRAKDGTYYVYYTAFNPDIQINGKSVQSVMRAKGKDLYHLVNDGDFLLTADEELYESFDWRDPYVFYHEEEKCYWMLLAARRRGSGALRGGCIALCKSVDMEKWSYEEPFFEPHMYVTMECPELFRMGKWWYLVFSTFSDRFVTHYRMAESPYGPWMIPDDDVFDARTNYAVKTASDGEKRYAFGWIPSRKGECDFGAWEWGGTMVFHEIVQDKSNGILTVRPAGDIEHYYNKISPLPKPLEVWSRLSDGMKLGVTMYGAALWPAPEDCYSLEMDICIDRCHEFGIALHTDTGLEKGYFLRMDPFRKQMAWDMWPRAEQGFYQWQIDGDRAYQVETLRRLPEGNNYHILIIREKDICVVYINNEVALSTRMYDHKGGYAGLYLVQGSAVMKNVTIKTKE